MNDNICTECRALLNGLSHDKGQATRLEQRFPHCACEVHSVGAGSPGKVLDTEVLYRLVISPGDIDSHGNIISTAFRNAYEDGLSVFREQSSDDHIRALITDRLTRRPEQPIRTVQALLRVTTLQIRENRDDELFGRFFCVYDETVPRKDSLLSPVPTHVTILQRLDPPETPDRKRRRNKGQHILHNVLSTQRVDIGTFRNGLVTQLNAASEAGAFIMVGQESA